MTQQSDVSRIWDVLEAAGVGMLTTRFEGGLRARPLEPRPDRDAHLIWFVTDVRGFKDNEIEAHADVCLSVIDGKSNAYLSITGKAEVLHDAALAAQHWRKTDNVWWDGPSDPNVCVIRLALSLAELWDGPSSTLAIAYEFLKARVTGAAPNLGENRKSTFHLP